MVSNKETRDKPEAKNGGSNKGYLVCDNCADKYKLKKGEFSEDFDKCECGGELKYHEYDNHEDNTVNIKSVNKFSKLFIYLLIGFIVVLGIVIGLSSFFGVTDTAVQCPVCGSYNVEQIDVNIYHCNECSYTFDKSTGNPVNTDLTSDKAYSENKTLQSMRA